MTEECPPLRLGNAPKYRNRKLATRRATVRIAVNALHTEMSRIPGTLADSVASIAISTASTVDNLESTLGKKLRTVDSCSRTSFRLSISFMLTFWSRKWGLFIVRHLSHAKVKLYPVSRGDPCDAGGSGSRA